MSTTIQRLAATMTGFGLKHASVALGDLLERAEIESQGPREFLRSVFDVEAQGRNERRRSRNYAAAHFPPSIRPLEEFDPEELEAGISAGQIQQLKELNWLDSCGNVIFAGPPGLGKTMIALGLGLHAINEGYTVCFEKMENFVSILDRAPIERTAGFRLKNIRKAQLLILDEIGYTPITSGQASRLFSFVSDAYERTSIIFTTNKEISSWSEILGDPVLTVAMLDRILHHARCYSLKGKSYRLKHPELFGGQETATDE